MLGYILFLTTAAAIADGHDNYHEPTEDERMEAFRSYAKINKMESHLLMAVLVLIVILDLIQVKL
ncbi:hypothetical protein IKG12_02055 [Candidatus Saccharibacteria bacterium]|nr:hypothetical protein [Candidatus Saccharibacteria bacterium]